MFSPVPLLFQQFSDQNGNPLAGGKFWSYIAGTNTPSSTFTDASGSTPNPNPIILDSNGWADAWIAAGGGAYKFVLMDANDVVLKTVDDVNISAADVPTGWSQHDVTDGQSETALAGETVDLSLYSSAFYDVEIKRGTTVISSGRLSVQGLNGTGRVVVGEFISEEPHGVVFSVTQVGTVVTLCAALDSGAGDGTITVSRRLVLV